jgi:hypothetical protein|tara:strand:+ start:209 stop:487 length:279 start_codon:yes stop_codon:yes gene_type:complete
MGAERKFKVIALSMGGKYNKVYNSGDEITQDSVEASVDELVDAGFLEELKAKKELIPSYKEVSSSEIKTMLAAKGVDFDDNASKKELYNLLK